MKHQTELVGFDREYREFVIALTQQLHAPKPLPLILNGLAAGASDALCVEAVRACAAKGQFTLLLVSEEKDGRQLVAALLQAGVRAAYFPFRDLLFDFVTASHDIERERLFVLSQMLRGGLDAVISTPPAALQLTMPGDLLASLSFSLSPGDIIPPSVLSDRLSRMGYAPVEVVESAGQFSCRGGIVDIFGYGSAPTRIEFFDDEVDRMGNFDPEMQRVYERCERVDLCPAYEVILTEEVRPRLLSHLKDRLKKTTEKEVERVLRAEIAALEGGTELCSRDKYISAIYDKKACLLDFLPQGRTPVFLIASSEMEERTKAAQNMERETVSAMVEAGLVSGKYAVYSKNAEELEGVLAKNVPIYLNQFGGVNHIKASGGLFGFRCRHTASYRDNFRQLCEDLEDYRKALYRVLILCPSEGEVQPLLAGLADAGIPSAALPEDSPLNDETLPLGSVRVGVGVCRGGYDLPNPKVALLNMGEDGAAPRRRKRRAPHKKVSAGEAILSSAELRPGDLVVHEAYGIGRFVGIQNMTVLGVSRDYITIQYAGTDRLFVPADRLELISKYIGAGSEDGTAKLSKMGAPEWQKTKSRAKGAAKELAKDLIALYAARQQLPGFAYPPDSDLEREFDQAFEFEETDPQLQACDEIKADMMRPVPMDRLLCGDVGFGKTEVALRAAFKAICAGKQVALLVPTTILALQHYQTALSRMRGFPVTVEMLCSFRTATQQTRILRALKRGDIDLLVGTHSLLGRRVEWKDLGLLIVDEEQRFGVAQKERLKQVARNIDVLTLSATPIPRTLNMAMSGIRDMSILDEAPVDRFPVQTYVMEHDDEMINEAIRREIRRGGQVLYLYNRTETIALVAARIARAVPEAHVTWAHGQMEKNELEQIWQSLVRGEIDVLVCTTIIETGVDLPAANTLIIEDADRMGLSQLHQLRGRVGRSGRRAYAYFTFRRGKALSDVATKRLEAIREYASFGAGFRIAMKDLEIRGAGNLLGPEQHGNIESVGYDLYVRLLQEAILEEQGKKPEQPFECTVDIRCDALIPETYIPSGALRMDMYKKISHIASAGDRMDILDEFCDRFGEPPVAVLRLLYVAQARAIGAHVRMSRIEQVGGELRFRCEKPDLSLWSELFAQTDGLTMRGGLDAYVCLRLKRGDDPCERAAELMERYGQLYDKAKAESDESPAASPADGGNVTVGRATANAGASRQAGDLSGNSSTAKATPAPSRAATLTATQKHASEGGRTPASGVTRTASSNPTAVGLPRPHGGAPARPLPGNRIRPERFFGPGITATVGTPAPGDMYGTADKPQSASAEPDVGRWPGCSTTGSSSAPHVNRPSEKTDLTKRRGRPPKTRATAAFAADESDMTADRTPVVSSAPKKRGRPPKNKEAAAPAASPMSAGSALPASASLPASGTSPTPKKRGRPPKQRPE